MKKEFLNYKNCIFVNSHCIQNVTKTMTQQPVCVLDCGPTGYTPNVHWALWVPILPLQLIFDVSYPETQAHCFANTVEM